jgi:hypothetical protein
MTPGSAVAFAQTPPRAFGVGCFHFSPRTPGPRQFTVANYAEDVRMALQRVATVNNVEIDYEDIDPPFELPAGAVLSLDEGAGFYPNPTVFHVSFDLYIPFRIQEELVAETNLDRSGTEHFRVQINYTYHAPVAFIESVGPRAGWRPSSGVQAVREYLEREMSTEDSPVVFEYLGPSPFHAEFYLQEVAGFASADGRAFTVDCVRSRGYADLRFKCAIGAFDSPEEALDELYYQLGDELGLFYDFTSSDADGYRAWGSLQLAVIEVTESSTTRKVLDRARATWTRGAKIRDLHAGLIRFEANQLLEKHRLDTYLKSTYAADDPAYLRSFLEATAGDRPVFPTQQIGQLVAFLEERRSRAIELLIVLVAALVGGVAGSLVTLLAHQ